MFTFVKAFLKYSFNWNLYHHLNDDKSLQVHLKPWIHEHIKVVLCILCYLRFFIYICTLLKWTPAIEALCSWTSKRHGYRSVYHTVTAADFCWSMQNTLQGINWTLQEILGWLSILTISLWYVVVWGFNLHSMVVDKH